MTQNIPTMINGIPVIFNELLVKQCQRRTHKKKRINKKWRKRYGITVEPDKQLYLFTPPDGGQRIAAHPHTWAAVQRAMERQIYNEQQAQP